MSTSPKWWQVWLYVTLKCDKFRFVSAFLNDALLFLTSLAFAWQFTTTETNKVILYFSRTLKNSSQVVHCTDWVICCIESGIRTALKVVQGNELLSSW